MASGPPLVNCGDDTSLFEYAQGGLALHEREAVEAHVNACDDCRHVLAEALRGLSEPRNEEEEHDEPPRRIGRYTLVELLGAGASGVVYRAFDPELERTVALKLLRSDASEASTERREKRLREARTMARVSDPNVVTVFDAGLSNGAVYIVMEYVEGSTLEDWLRREKRQLGEIVDAFLAAGRGLAALHDRALVHRDFKAENVMIGRDGRIQVTDFGLARPLSAVEATSAREGVAAGQRITLTQGLFGTPAYMAPELFAGQPADAMSDQFSFAVSLVAAVTGRHPFGADERISVSELVLRMHGDQRGLSGHVAGLPVRLQAALLRALSAAPAERFPGMTALLSELEGSKKVERRPRAHRAFWLALAASTVCGAAAFALSRARPDEAVLPPRPAATVTTAATATATAAAPATGTSASGGKVEVPERSGPPEREAAPAAIRPPRAARSTARRPVPVPPPPPARYDDRLKDPF